MTKMEIIKEIGLNNYYSSKQQPIATKRALSKSKELLEQALNLWRKDSRPQTREFIGRVLTGFFKFNTSVSEVK